MIGAIIGDIVGSRFEWDNHRSKDFDFLTHQCFFTDDSVMSLAVCDALMHCKPDYSDLSNITIALLNTADNAALNNSTFDVKRNDIIQMDKKGQYIPFCTKMVFLKYYTPSAENQLHFWGQADRIAYIKAINDVLSDYIEPIVLEKEETK